MNVLFLSQRIPFPPNRGDKITTWRLIERLAREHTVRVVSFAHDEADQRAARDLQAKGFEVHTFPVSPRWKSMPLLLGSKPLTLGVYGSDALQRKVDELAPDSDFAYAFSSSMGAFLLPHAMPWVMHFAELDSDKWSQYVEKTRFPMSWVYKREARTLFEFEKRVAAASLTNVFCTPLEETIFKDRIPGPPALVMRNGVDLSFYEPSANAPEANHLIFVGVMDYYPNVEGCQWFCAEILPRIRERVPDVKLSIVGSHPTAEVERLGKIEGVTVTGFVDDTRDWLRKATVSIAPLRIARGIQNKVLEAMAMGLPVVGTTSATQGVDGKAGRDYLVEDEVPGQVEAICGLLRDSNQAAQLGKQARLFVEENYDWEACLRPLDGILSSLPAAPRSTSETL